MAPAAEDQGLPAHIAETIASIAALRAQHDERGKSGLRTLRKSVALVTRPGVLSVVLALPLAWALANGIGEILGYRVIDPAPFLWLVTALAVASLWVTLTILSIQRRDDALMALREQLSLELAILGEQKNAKIIELLEELRRDLPLVPNRADDQASEMARPADPNEVMEAIESTQGGGSAAGGDAASEGLRPL